ncbi:MAG: hypothetical protein HC938_07410 [Nitrospira sp.]|nr:hypothetical protein [Nitrospira sp.]
MSTQPTFLPAVATIDLTALAHNLLQLRRILSPSCGVMGVVKANAYGHGAVEISQTLTRHGVVHLAVFSIEEGIALRQAGITVSIVILGPIFREQLEDIFAYRLTPVVSNPSTLIALGQHAAQGSSPYPIHLKIETGMGRLGLTQNELETILAKHTFPSSLRLEGLMSHLADSDGSDPDPTDQQICRFERAIKSVREAGFSVPLIHYPIAPASFAFHQPTTLLFGQGSCCMDTTHYLRPFRLLILDRFFLSPPALHSFDSCSLGKPSATIGPSWLNNPHGSRFSRSAILMG